MSQFNLERFRFQKSSACKAQNTSSESEKENKPAQMKSTKSHSAKSHARGVFFEDSGDDDEPLRKISFSRKFREPVVQPSANVTEDEKKEEKSQKESKLAAMFPQLSTKKLSEVVESTSTLDGAVATCLLISDDEDKDRVGKTEHNESDSSLEIVEDQPYQRRKQSEEIVEDQPYQRRKQSEQIVGSFRELDVALDEYLLISDEEDTDYARKRKPDDSDSSLCSVETLPYKRKKQSELSEAEDYGDYNHEDDGGNEPSWEKQEAMVKRLQKKFPNQDKEELRSVLQEHNWDDVEALHALLMFSGPDETSFSSPEYKPKEAHHPKSKEKSVKEQSNVHRRGSCENKMDAKVNTHKDVSDTDNSSDATVDSDDYSAEEEAKHSSSTLSSWITKDSFSSVKRTTSSYQKPSCSSSSSAAQILSRFASGTSLAKKRAEERKRTARAAEERFSSDNEDDADLSSEFEDYDEALTKTGGVKEEILKFFQEATIDELALISGCSVKKANKIIELRPFKNWLSLTSLFQKNNGLSEELLLGCKRVLKERTIVRGLMCKCETISSKMVTQVREVMMAGMGAMQQPSLLNSQLQLKPYQLIGLKWLLLLHEHNLSGILADEMGLGKTIQAIAFLGHLFQKGVKGPHLITVPSSTLDNWVRELKMWCPSLKVLVFCGSMEDRHYLKHDILNGAVEFNVLVTTYTLATGKDSDRSMFRKLRLAYAIFDEGHMLKNMNSLRYRHLMSINAQHRLLLTGTPLQNNLLELMSLLNFIMPSMFSSSTTQLSKMFSMKSHEEQSQFQKDRISQAKRIMKPFILRRVKNEVLKQLPDKEEKVEYCSMSEKQQVFYQTLLKKLKDSAGEKRELSVMMQLRKMANHPLLHRQYYTTEKLKAMSELMLKEPTHHDANAACIQEDMAVMSDFELHRLCQQYASISSYQLENSQLLDSGKFHWLTERLASLKDKGDRVVLFSQFTMMLDIVEVLMKHLKHRYIRLDGSTPIADRIVLIDEFNNDTDVFVFLLSTRAGGLGINLTSANVVILHDIDWNPYNDKQAEDRCHRLGQTRTVQVIKLISKDSIEDGILQLGQKKLKLEQDMTTAEQCDEGAIPEDMASLLKASLGM
ncbi:SWI/SNF-related matrix-associated actin-dependent regulator of chromatin subfamily A containing DEAD/H box 1A isoform X2 [Phyllopteryx taeniolatus]|uniref:SWI/SNF-related matrix-associated actin-dependent regulator of chromatin subfamily A containing DEAD/H box 1A isoform X2 n=1 Tax=Phyllopteryx taeniolatus TaxID=161469 RepID=UPI002AD50071|nr:SWI/SNF-related matrix-associated actin-dependent regulator of chromatin subfamily A containing DEAD/H box 1A isoform X2 [Phyllopteryx taeniolatus]